MSMARPLSMVSPTTLPVHRRNASTIKAIPRTQSPSAISLYITNLRLLDLDQLTDWPNISSYTLSSDVDVKSRIRAVEWSLYHLFRLYDARLTTDKLQPFFPPLEHLQSLNLRAALHRCLGELKKNGALGREAVLRKTMLDDCTGEKFWELCLAFSGVVLRKLAVENKERSTQPVAQRLASTQCLSRKDRDSLLPLAIAHKSALTKVLATKQHRRQSYMQVHTMLQEKDQDLQQRRFSLDNQANVIQSSQQLHRLQELEHIVEDQWSTDDSFKDAILNGDPAKAADHILLQSPAEFLDYISGDSPSVDSRRDSGVVEDIQLKFRAQNARVKEWQTLHDQIRPEVRQPVVNAAHERSVSNSTELVFEQHHDMTIDDVQPAPTRSSTSPTPIPAYVSRYDTALTIMREELRRSHSVRREAMAPVPVRNPSVTLDAVAGAARSSTPRSPSNRSVSPTFPLRPGFDRRLSSRSRSYQQPKVNSQRQPIPLKTELISPIRSSRSISPTSAGSTALTSPVDLANSPDTIDAAISSSTSALRGNGVAEDNLSSMPQIDAPKSRKRVTVARTVSFADQPDLSTRTRTSMSAARVPDGPCEDSVDITSDVVEPQDSLMSRTRQSMSSMNLGLPVRPTEASYRSEANDETSSPALASRQSTDPTRPGAPAPSTHSNQQPTNFNASRNITPRETLFEAHAEYQSVFRSRPKIASSPVLSPTINGNHHGEKKHARI